MDTPTIRLWQAADDSGVIEAVHPGGRSEYIGPLTAADLRRLTAKHPRVLSPAALARQAKRKPEGGR